ncbi:BRCT domain [Lasallia pustulata]|uniref:BRCT domain n=1 Tax=Lasallia pustulata TaxID=136370 RepID=A0A1W5CYU9_9LECA|nr:BRCT domain [Lasallia pustulata]
MTSSRALLREHINSRSSKTHLIILSTSEEPRLSYLHRRPTGDDDTWELTVHSDSDYQSGIRDRSSAVLHAYLGNVLLEALGAEIHVRPPRLSYPWAARHMGVRLQPSTQFTRDRVHLRPGDSFDIGDALFKFELYEGEEVQVASSAVSDTAAVTPSAVRSLEANVPFAESDTSDASPPVTVTDDVSGQPTKDIVPSVPQDVIAIKQMPVEPVNPDITTAPTSQYMPSNSVVMAEVYASEEDAQALASGAEDTQESTRWRSDYLLNVAVDSQQPSSSQTDGLPIPDIRGPQPCLDGELDPSEPMMDARLDKKLPTVRISSTHDKDPASRLSKLKRKLSNGDMSDIITPAKAVKLRKIQNPSNSEHSNDSTIVAQTSGPKSARARGPTKSAPLAEKVQASPSARTRASVSSSQSSSAETKPRILFASSTNIDTQPHIMSFLRRHGAIKVESVQRCNLLCVGKGKELKKTSKLIHAIVSGIGIVTDEWILQSVKDNRLLDSSAYPAKDPEREAEWGITLVEAIERGKQGRKPFQDWTILFTPTLKKELGKGFAELKDIATHAGAKTVRAAVPRKKSSEMEQTLLLAAECDKDLHYVQQNGWRCYSKDVLTLSVLRGVLDTDGDEFLLPINESD